MGDTYFHNMSGRWAIGPHISMYHMNDALQYLDIDHDILLSDASTIRRQYWFDTTNASYISKSYEYTGRLVDKPLSEDPRYTDVLVNGDLDLREFSGHAIPMKDHLYKFNTVMPKLIKCYSRVYRYVNSGDPLTSKTSYDIAARNLSNIASMLEPENHTYIKQQLARDMYFIDNDMMHYLNNTYRKYRLKNRDESSMKTLDGKYTNI